MTAKLLLVAFFALLAGTCFGKSRHLSHMKITKPMIKTLISEAHALRRTKENEEVPPPTAVHYGCFLGKNLQLLNNTILDGNTNVVCQKYCYEMKHMFSATHDDTCGCLKDHPEKELSGPTHEGATEEAGDSVHDCTAPCPGHATEKCEKRFCCGGPGAYTVYQVGGIKTHSVAALKVLREYKVSLEKTHLIPDLRQTGKRYEVSKASLKEMMNEQVDPEDYKAFLEFMEYNKSLSHKYNACCSPDCNWLLEYLEIDGSVVKCVD